MAQVKKSRFEEIRARCLSAGILYEDPEFPAVPKSVYFSKKTGYIQWRRPVVGMYVWFVGSCTFRGRDTMFLGCLSLPACSSVLECDKLTTVGVKSTLVASETTSVDQNETIRSSW